ncbi:MAG: prolyl oligopeptidase family serine peptidase [Acidobacteriaceae bacterium]
MLPPRMRFTPQLVACLVFALPWTAQARKDPPHRQDTGFLNRTIALNGSVYRYDVYLPMDYDPHRTWPMILFLHGSGERGSDGLDETQVGLPNAIRAHPERWPFVVVMPQVPYSHHHWTDPDMMAMALAALEAEVKEFHGNPEQLYLTGLSLGGYGAWEIAKDHPGRFAAIVPVSGGIFWSYEPRRWRLQNVLPAAYTQAIGKTPVWMFHGLLDPVVTPKQSEIMYQALSASGGNVRLWEYEGWHHNAWDKAYADPSLPAWLLAHHLSQIAASRPDAEKRIIPLHPPAVHVDPNIYTAYEGEYYDGEVRQVTILREGDRLFSKNRTGDLTELLAENNVTFFYPSGSSVRLTFEKDASGHVTGILYHDDRHDEHWEKLSK